MTDTFATDRFTATKGNGVTTMIDDDQTPRPPPVNYEAEQALLGAILDDNYAYDAVVDFLSPTHFADAVHGRIFAAIGKLIERGEAASVITLKTLFDQDEALAEVGGAKYLVQLQQNTITIVNAEHYGRTIIDLFRRRESIATYADTIDEMYECDLDRPAESIIEANQGSLDAMLGTGERGGLELLGRRFEGALEQIEEAYKAQATGASGLSTGLSRLDRKIGGLKKAKVYVLAGRTSMGKTSLAENIAFTAARAGKRVAFFSLEMTTEDVIQREISRITGIASDKINNGWVSETEMDRVIDTRAGLQDLPLLVDDSSDVSVSAIRARARRMKRAGGLDLVIIDYLQLMSGDRMGGRVQRYEEIGQITRAVKTGIAKDLKVPVLLLSQLSRQVENRDDKRPHLPDLRESGSIEQDADVVLFLYREEYYLRQESPMRKQGETVETFEKRERNHAERSVLARGKAEIIVAKQRSGPTGTVHVQFDAPRMRFHEGEDGPAEVEPVSQEEIVF